MVIAGTPEEAQERFKELTKLDSAPPEYDVHISSIELIQEDVGEDVTISDLIQTERTLN